MSGVNSVTKPRYPGPVLRSRRASACSALLSRMQEHGKILAHRLVPGRLQFLGAAADDHVVPLADFPTQQRVPYRAAHQVHLHPAMVLKFTLRLSVVVASLLLGGCYLMQATRGQLTVMKLRQPIDTVIARKDTSDTLKAQLIRARDIRDFASRELGLPDNGAYRSYADIGRPYVVWNVVATPEFSVQPLEWCFPIAGCVAYRGYFNEKAAKDFAADLKARGRDVVVGGVPAYSTLGHIADPLLNTVINYGQLDLAALVFHELAHQVAYLPGDSSFNEAFATAVEEAGVARYAAQLPDRHAAATLAAAAPDARGDHRAHHCRARGSQAHLHA